MTSHVRSRRLLTVAAAAVLAVAGPLAPAASAGPGRGVDFQLTVLHNNDGESKLLGAPGQPDFGGVARFATLVDGLRAEGEKGGRRGAIMVSSGDNFLAGPEFNASLRKGVPFYDALALKAVGYDAMAIGNHEFDFGPDTLADFIESFGSGGPPFVSANLDMSDEERLAALVERGTVVSSATVRRNGERIGIVGATTPALASISSPRRVKVLQNVAGLIQDQVDALSARGVDKVVLISHLQGLTEDRALVPMLRNVDVVIAGGGDELMASDTTPLVPGDTITKDPATGQPLRYPLYARDGAGVDVPVVTTAGDYKYVGRLVVNFDRRGKVVGVDRSSGPVRVSGVAPDAVAPDPEVQRTVVEPVKQFVDGMAANVVAQSAVALDGRRDPGVRTKETNLGNLMADSLLASGRRNAASYGVTPPDVALQNGGGIRNNNLIPAGRITELDTFSIAPFGNFVSVVPNVPRAQFKEILENAVSRVPVADGRFAQVAGFRFEYDPSGTAQVVNDAGTVLTPGTRVRTVTLDDGTKIVENGQVVPGPALSVATNDFSARGGDQWPFRGLPFTTVGVTYQQALLAYITGDLNGQITATAYPETGSGRITTTP
ncbi:bifunctional metallophosphatase/5'-nucleotidase [Thermomonospora amylolytica]|uniref:bifunctional metallophosphatase/5'-nucleotidase n=1 Tax=Thermomonospora amylolytica TaxID=1411117 RepID=UPI000E6D3C7E|nr:5'-nucleotidase C-terminal domain-containing protein [Thermomonospora amylolytica]